MLKGARDPVAREIKVGKTMVEMKQEKLLGPSKRYSGDFINADTFVETIYNSLTGQKNRKFIKDN